MKTENVRSRTIEEVLPLKNKIGDMSQIEVSVAFTSGGTNYFSGSTSPKCYRVSVSPCEITTHKLADGTEYKSRSSVLMSGKRDSGLAYRIEECKRYNEKRLKELASLIEAEKIASWYEEENDTAIQNYLRELVIC
jgi:hypothetical protein